MLWVGKHIFIALMGFGSPGDRGNALGERGFIYFSFSAGLNVLRAARINYFASSSSSFFFFFTIIMMIIAAARAAIPAIEPQNTGVSRYQ